MIADAGGGSTITVRANMDTFTGKAVVHCHLLQHEDEGMMAWIAVDGTEGAKYDDAKTIDPTCYDGAYPTPGLTLTLT